MIVTWKGTYDIHDSGSQGFMDHDAGWEYTIKKAKVINGFGDIWYDVSVKIEDEGAVKPDDTTVDEGTEDVMTKIVAYGSEKYVVKEVKCNERKNYEEWDRSREWAVSSV